jgi:hypothetical protein
MSRPVGPVPEDEIAGAAPAALVSDHFYLIVDRSEPFLYAFANAGSMMWKSRDRDGIIL